MFLLNKINTFVVVSLISQMALSDDILKIDLVKPLTPPLDVFQISSDKIKTNLPKLAQIKKDQLRGEYQSCATGAEKYFSQEKQLQGWLALTWMQCLSGMRDSAKKESMRDQTSKALENFVQQDANYPWSKDLRELWLKFRLESLESQTQKKESAAVKASIARLLDSRWQLDKSQNQKVYELLGEQAYLGRENDEALFFFQQSQFYGGSPRVSERLRFLTSGENLKADTAANTTSPVESSLESQIEKRMNQSLLQRNSQAALDDLLSLLRDYPGSRVTQRNQGKALEIYTNSTPDTREKILKQISKAPGSILADWAQTLAKRGDYNGSLILIKAAFSQSEDLLRQTQFLVLAGRAGHFVGDYTTALHYFDRLMTEHAGTPEAAEAQFRSALIYLRQGEYGGANALLEKLILQNTDRYGLLARYWNVRALEAAKSDKFVKAAQELIDLYPWTYYGLRLRAEINKNQLEWPISTTISAKNRKAFLYLAGESKKNWLRFRKLSEVGWLNEAHAELKNLPESLDATTRLDLAERLKDQLQYFGAIRLINSAQDESPSLVSEKQIRWAYPLVYEAYYKNEEKRYGVSAVLLRSLTRQESGFFAKAISSSRALGLMQMIPPTAQEISDQLGLKVQIPDDMFRPETNITMGSYYVNKMVSQFRENIPFALAAYNAGPQRVKAWISLRPELQKALESPTSQPLDEIWFDELPWSETSFYVKAILRNIYLYRLVEKSPLSVNGAIWADLLEKKTK